MKFHLLSCGCCFHPEWSCMRTAPFKKAEFPAHLGLIEHPQQGLVLFDTGYSRQLDAATAKFPQSLYTKLLPYTLLQGDDLPNQLSRLGHRVQDVKWIVISHFHPDHIAGLRDFPSAKIICAREGWEDIQKASGWQAFFRGYMRGLLPDDAASRVSFIEARPLVKSHHLPGFETGFDLFNDGTLLVVPLPGHAPGHFGLYLKDQDDKDVFLIADACWRSAAYRHFVLPPAITMRILYDPKIYEQTLLALHRLSLMRDDIALIPSHCNEVSYGKGRR